MTAHAFPFDSVIDNLARDIAPHCRDWTPQTAFAVREALRFERAYQAHVWTSATSSRLPTSQTAEGAIEPTKSAIEFLMYIDSYLRRAIDIMVDRPQPAADEKVLDVVRKCAAMTVASLELHGTSGTRAALPEFTGPLSVWLLRTQSEAHAMLQECARSGDVPDMRFLARQLLSGMAAYGVVERPKNDLYVDPQQAHSARVNSHKP